MHTVALYVRGGMANFEGVKCYLGYNKMLF